MRAVERRAGSWSVFLTLCLASAGCQGCGDDAPSGPRRAYRDALAASARPSSPVAAASASEAPSPGMPLEEGAASAAEVFARAQRALDQGDLEGFVHCVRPTTRLAWLHDIATEVAIASIDDGLES